MLIEGLELEENKWHLNRGEKLLPRTETLLQVRYRQADFAVNLAEVTAEKAQAEYQDPIEYFRSNLSHRRHATASRYVPLSD